MKHLVVGLDNSSDAEASFTWAEGAIGSSGTMHVVHAVPSDDDRPAVETWLMDRITRSGVPSDRITGEVVVGEPADGLLTAAARAGADAVVVGAHGRSLLEPRALGKVAVRLLSHSPVPLVVVRRGAIPRLDATGTIVVGIGHSEATRGALRWAATEADERGMAMSLVRATGTRSLFDDAGLLEVLAYYLDPPTVHEWAEADLAELAAELEQSADGRLRVSWTATSGRAGPRLVEAATGAALLVVGRHHDSGLTDHFTVGALHHALAHAPCPVVVVPTTTDG